MVLCQHWIFFRREASLHLLPIPGPGGGSSVLSDASSTEPSHLQHEEPGAQRFNMETAD